LMQMDLAHLVSIGFHVPQHVREHLEIRQKCQTDKLSGLKLKAHNVESCRRRMDIDAIIEAIARQVESGEMDISGWGPYLAWQRQAPYRREEHLKPCQVIRRLAGCSKKALAAFLTSMGLSVDDVLPPALILPTRFNVYGCPDSRDINVIAQWEELDVVEKVWQGQVAVDDSAIRRELEVLGYNLRRQLNIDLIWIHERNDIGFCSSGARAEEVQNWLLGTYGMHAQKYACLLKSSVSLDVLTQARAAAKYVLDYWRPLIGEDLPKSDANERAALLGCGHGGKGDAWKRVDLAISGLERIALPDPCRLNTWLSQMKSLCTRIIQLALLVHGVEAYSVRELVSKSTGFCDYPEGLLYLLSDGCSGDFNVVSRAMKQLWQAYREIVVDCREGVTWCTKPLSIEGMKNPTLLPDVVFADVLSSPLVVPQTLIDCFRAVTPDGESPVLPEFRLRSSTESSLPSWLRHRVELCDQRDPEWMYLYRYYLCGRHSESVTKMDDVDKFVESNYHLIRGCVMEMVLRDCVDYKELLDLPNCYTASVGFIVEQKGVEGSPGCAPDLLVIVPDSGTSDCQSDDKYEVIPVEMKCMREGFAENANYRREVSMATTQLRTCLDLIGRGTRGLIMMLWWDGSSWELRHSLVDFSGGGPLVGRRAVA